MGRQAIYDRCGEEGQRRIHRSDRQPNTAIPTTCRTDSILNSRVNVRRSARCFFMMTSEEGLSHLTSVSIKSGEAHALAGDRSPR